MFIGSSIFLLRKLKNVK
ncbi:hypothetical protein BUZ08_06225 [Staphylococcus gallinarum]|nr:hypothetical protein [Staphylococcus gallinarum]MCD8858602.1 hypothetical protein [Staphylococcus gallinarum]PTL17424.1 hypothetical protein BUZ08_06225 [Staphylococcus gallinarum]RIO79427.1 hypothetical protein BUZ07_06450 [Staphylococcus gallinarum]